MAAELEAAFGVHCMLLTVPATAVTDADANGAPPALSALLQGDGACLLEACNACCQAWALRELAAGLACCGRLAWPPGVHKCQVRLSVSYLPALALSRPAFMTLSMQQSQMLLRSSQGNNDPCCRPLAL